jgi:predicted PurR-regulated permease PerM
VAFFDEPKKAVIALVYYVVYQQIENYVVAPRIMQRTVSVPGAITIIAALVGGTLLGMLGALLAIPVAAGMLLIYEEVLLPRQRRA